MTGIICVNKPKDITSFGIVSKIKGITGERKAGHTGTLDPMATGVLPVMLGGATKFLNFLPDSDKGYRAVFQLGKTTDTLDVTGRITSQRQVSCSAQDVKNILENFKGRIEQIPPMYSAKSVDGVRLYDLARQGKEINRKPCSVEIKQLNLVSCDEYSHMYTIDVMCSKGTYIRSLIDDIGNALGCGAVMTELCRTYAMGFGIEKTFTLQQLQDMKDSGTGFESALLSVEELFSCYKRVDVTGAQSTRFFNGGALDIERIKKNVEPNEVCRVYNPQGEFLGLGQHRDNEIKVLRVLSVRS